MIRTIRPTGHCRCWSVKLTRWPNRKSARPAISGGGLRGTLVWSCACGLGSARLCQHDNRIGQREVRASCLVEHLTRRSFIDTTCADRSLPSSQWRYWTCWPVCSCPRAWTMRLGSANNCSITQLIWYRSALVRAAPALRCHPDRVLSRSHWRSCRTAGRPSSRLPDRRRRSQDGINARLLTASAQA